MLTIFILLTGFVFLLKGADALVEGSSTLAKRLGVSDLVIGLTIVAFGTSAPELFVNLLASSKDASDLAIGNILGSNIANGLLILGISAIILPLQVGKGTVWREIPFALLATLIVGVLVNDTLLGNGTGNFLSLSDGLILLAFFSIFLHYTFSIAKKRNESLEMQVELRHSTLKSIFYIIAGLVGLVVGGQFIVESSIEVATWFGLSQSLIGLTVVAVGTSLPELAASATAAFKGRPEIAIGNVVGSNIFNIFWILGVSSLLSNIRFGDGLNFDLTVAILSAILLFVLMFIGKKHTIERWQGGLMLLGYVAYLVVIVVRG